MFENRIDAGKKLGARLLKEKLKNVIVLAIPRGGVPVGFAVARTLKAKLDIVVPRKLPIPSDPEAGFGAVINNMVTLNGQIVSKFGLSKREIGSVVREVRAEVKRRIKVYRGSKLFPSLKGKTVILVDDGLASGYTMLAAVKWLKSKKAGKVIVAVPVSSSNAASLVRKEAELICLQTSKSAVFAVADFYKEWRDLSDVEVINYLKMTKN